MDDPLDRLWPQFDLPRPLFSPDMLRHWPSDAANRLQAAGFLRQAETAQRVICPGCYEGHVEDVVTTRFPDGLPRLFVYCPEVLRAEVPAESLRQWTIDFERLAGALARALAVYGKLLPLVPNRLWRLGKALWRGTMRDVFLVRGVTWSDAPQIVGRIGRSRCPIVLVSNCLPPIETWGNCRPAVIPLPDVAWLDEDALAIDAASMAALVADADAAWDDRGGPTLDKRQLRQLIRAQRDSQLQDDVLVAAYKQFGSYRKAADGLIAQGVETDRWKVERAIQRAGGTAALCRDESSLSVVRDQRAKHRKRTRS